MIQGAPRAIASGVRRGPLLSGAVAAVVPWPDPSEVFALEIGGTKLPLILIAIMTFVLISSSGTMAMAVNFAYRRDRVRTAWLMLLTADHGNIEMMKDPTTHEPYTAHTTLDVPVIAFGAPPGAKLENGRLADVAPTVLDMMGLKQPAAMTGHSLLVRGA